MKKSFKKVIITVLLFILLILTVSGYMLFDKFMGSINKIDNETIVTVAPEEEDFETEASVEYGELTAVQTTDSAESYSVEPIDDEQLINILLVGQDRTEGQSRQRSDTMILCSYNSSTNEVSMISFLRDLYVTIPGGYSKNRLNAPYVFGGFPLLYSTFKENFGVSIDAGVEVDFEGFRQLVDLLGGVDLYLTAAEATQVPGSKEGMNHLDGEMALNYARIRKIDNDFGRTNRQRTLLLALFEKVKTSDKDTLMKLLNTALSMVTTDMSNTTITSVAAALLPQISSLKINTYAVPFDGSYRSTYVNGMAVLIPDLKAIRDKLANEYLPLESRAENEVSTVLED